MPNTISDIYNAIELLQALQTQESIDGPARIGFMLIGVFSVILMFAFFITQESKKPSKGQKVSMGFTMAWIGVLAFMLFESVPISDSELSAMNTLRELRSEETYSHDDYINFVMLANEIKHAEKFVKDTEELQRKLDALGFEASDEQVITLANDRF